jgi:hypothetical protein
MDRKDFYFKQHVTQIELDGAFESTESAIDRTYEDLAIIGIVSGATVNQHSPTPNMTVDIPAGIVIDQNGQRIKWASEQNLDCSIDENSASTAVASPGNSKYLAIFAEFDRALSDPRVDGNQDPVYFERAESFKLNVVQGAEGATPSKPSLRSTQILLADILITYGHTQIVTGDIDTDRREWAVTATSTELTIGCGTIEEGLQDIADKITTHITATGAGEHNASAIDYAGGSAWNDGGTNPATDVEAQIDKILTDLSGNDGADKIGALGQTSGAKSVATGSIEDQIGELLAFIDANFKRGQMLRAQNWTKQADVFSSGYIAHGITFTNGIYNNRLFVTVGDNTTAVEIFSSYDGVAGWTSRSPSGTPVVANDVTWDDNNSLFIWVGQKGAATGAEIQTSPDGITWTARTPTGMTASGDLAEAICYDPYDQVNIVVGGSGTTGKIIRSTNGTTWAAATTVVTASQYHAVAADGNGMLVAVGYLSTGPNSIIAYSTDTGLTWTAATGVTGTGHIYSVCYDAGSATWYACGQDGILSSSNGVAWSYGVDPESLGLDMHAIAADGNGIIVALAPNPSATDLVFVTSDGGTTWHLFQEPLIDGANVKNTLKFLGGQFWASDGDRAWVMSMRYNGTWTLT